MIRATDADVVMLQEATHPGAFARMQALLTLGRWWQPRFPAVVDALAEPLGQEELARALVALPAFEKAEGEDVKATAFVLGVLDLAAKGTFGEAPWLVDLLAYEYLLAVGLPRRAQRQDLDPDVEAKLLGKRAPDRGGCDRDVHAGFQTAASSITLTWPVTMCQPSSKRTQVWVWRPTLPGMVVRWNSVFATAKSRP